MMHTDLWPLQTLDDVDALLDESCLHPVLVLKHSRTCGTSAQALDELLAYLDEREPADVRFALVTVQTHRDVSNAIAQRLGIRHETPQALLVCDRGVAWHASHFRVTADTIAAAVAAHLPTSTR
jgi:bacillithiol system protein YtxJ